MPANENPYESPALDAQQPPAALPSAATRGGWKALAGGVAVGLLMGFAFGGGVAAAIGCIYALFFATPMVEPGEQHAMIGGMTIMGGILGAFCGSASGLVAGGAVGILAMCSRRTFRTPLLFISVGVAALLGVGFAVLAVMLLEGGEELRWKSAPFGVAASLLGAIGGGVGGWFLAVAVARVAWPPSPMTGVRGEPSVAEPFD